MHTWINRYSADSTILIFHGLILAFQSFCPAATDRRAQLYGGRFPPHGTRRQEKSVLKEVLMMKSLRARVGAVGLLAAAFCGNAQAAPIFYNWFLDFFQGPLHGQVAAGTLSVDGNDCPAGICSGTFNPDNVGKTLLSLNITVGGVPFAMANDTGFGSGFPDVTFNTLGRLTGVDYQGVVTSAGIQYELDTSNANVGEVVAFFQTSNPTNPNTRSLAVLAAVPEPGTLPLLGAAVLAGILLAWRRRYRTERGACRA